MIALEGRSLAVSGPMTIANAAELREQGLAKIAKNTCAINLSQVGALDSSALAVLLAWQRAAIAQGGRLRVESPPESLRSLANLYRLDELLDDKA